MGKEGKEHLPTSMKFMIGIMEAGPSEWYSIKVNQVREVEHLKQWDSIMKCGNLIYTMLSLILIIWLIKIIDRNQSLLKKVQK